MSEAPRVTLRVPERLLARVDRRVESGEFANRSEALREAARRMCLETECLERLCDEETRDDEMAEAEA